MIPLFVDCSGKRIVIFGGGEVASRKAAYFSGQADVLVVSRSFSHKMSILPVERQMLEAGFSGRKITIMQSIQHGGAGNPPRCHI